MSETEFVWVATELYPESTAVLVGADEGGVMRAIVDFIGRDEWDGFVASLKGDEATDVTYDDDPGRVLRVWAGECMDLQEDGVEGFDIGNDWRVVKTPVVRAAMEARA